MDPLYRSPGPDVADHLRLDADQVLYYELRGNKQGNPKLLMCMGAFATSAYYDQGADELAATGFSVLTFHNRGIGKSICTKPVLPPQSIELLAHDAHALVNHVWGPDSHVHVYGASMGGMVAQELAALLLAEKRLQSLYLAVTSLGGTLPWWARGLPHWAVRALVPFVFWYRRDTEVQMRRVLRQVFDASHVAVPHPHPDAAGATYGELWHRRWCGEAREWYCFHDDGAMAAQLHSLMHWNADEDKVKLIRQSGVPVMVHVALGDAIIPHSRQLELADALAAEVLTRDGGHMIICPKEAAEYRKSLVQHLQNAEKAWVVCNSDVGVEAVLQEGRDARIARDEGVEDAVPRTTIDAHIPVS